MMEQTEFLNADELIVITGRKLACKQIEWLRKNRWPFELNAAQKPIVSRFYTRQRLSGIKNTAPQAVEWQLDLSNIK